MNPKTKYVFNYFRNLFKIPREVQIGYGTGDQPVQVYQAPTGYWETIAPFPVETIVWKTWKDQHIPILFPGNPEAPVLEFRDDRAFIHDDILASAFFFLSGWQEYVYMCRHNAVRYPFQDSLQHRLNIARLPVVNYYFDILKTAVEKVYSLPLQHQFWGAAPFALCLTHDVDNVLGGWGEDLFAILRQRRPLAAAAIFSDLLSNRSTRFNFPGILAIEKKFDASSSFYFLARKEKVFVRAGREKGFVSEAGEKKMVDPAYYFRSRRSAAYTMMLKNADYDVRSPRFRELMERIRRQGSEVGIHGSFGSSLSLQRLQEDLQHLSAPVIGGRFHYLCFDITRTPDIIEQAGLRYDSTLGFAEQPGFRNGITYPFVPYHFREERPCRFLEIPLIAMDTTYRLYKKVARDEIFPDICDLMTVVEKFGGCLTLLWHNAYFSPYKFRGWGEIYEKILQEGHRRRALLLSGERVLSRWDHLLPHCNGSPSAAAQTGHDQFGAL